MKVGIDPGINGAIAFVSDENIKVFDMPVEAIPWARSSNYKRRVDAKGLYDLISKCPHTIESITIEIVGAMPKQGVSSTWHFSGAFHTATTVAQMFDYPIKMVLPAQWKKKFGLINLPKDASRLAVLRMYPDLLPVLKRKKDVDRAEAIMIAVS